MSFLSEPVNWCKQVNKIPAFISRFVRKHKELVIILFLSFIVRYFLLDWNSYWVDEIFSVYDRGLKFDSALEVLQYHRVRAASMPLYEFILYNWMSIFGHSEAATRLLSTIYVTLATFFLYLFAFRVFGRRVAVASILFFTVSYMAVFYSLESRYYGQILFFCTLSSYLLIIYLEGLTNNFSWKKLFLNGYFILLTFANVALMLSHPTTYLFPAAQGVFVYFYFLYQNRLEGVLLKSAKVFALYLAQVAFLVAVWGSGIFRFVASILGIASGGFGGDPVASGAMIGATSSTAFIPFKNPFVIFRDYIFIPNIEFPDIINKIINYLVPIRNFAESFLPVIFLLLVLIILIKLIIRYSRRSFNNAISSRKFFFLYVVFWALLPPVMLFLIYSYGQQTKLFARYLIYCIPPLMILFTLAFEQGIKLTDSLLKLLKRISLLRHYFKHAVVYAIIAAIFLVVPGGYRAATERKADWRGITDYIVQQIHLDPEHEYLVFETTRSLDYPLADYYYKQYSDQVRAYDVIKRIDEESVEADKNFVPRFMSEESRAEIEKHDYIIVTFIHIRAGRYPHQINLLSEEYDLISSHLNSGERGYLLFKVNSQ